MPETEYVSIQSDTNVPPSYEPHQRASPTAKRLTIASISRHARSSYHKTSTYTRSLFNVKQHYVNTRDFIKRTEWKQGTKNVYRATPGWIRYKFWPVAKYCLLHLSILTILVVVIVCLVFVSKIPGLLSTGADTCLPDGTFSIAGEDGWGNNHWSAWTIDGIFQITVGFGHFRFTIAKLLDVLFDIIVGRGLQAFFAAICYWTFTQNIQMTMESSPVAYETFEAVNFNAASSSQVVKLVRNLATNQGVPGKLRIIWMIFASMFVVAFSTLASAMSGYSARQVARFTVPGENISVPLEKLYPMPFVIHDFHRINQTTPYVISPTSDFYAASDPCWAANYEPNSQGTYINTWANTSSSCDYVRAVYFYAFTYGISLPKPVQNWSLFYLHGKAHNISAPYLTITSTWLDSTYEDYYQDPQTNFTTPVFNLNKYSAWSSATFLYNDTNTTYTYTQIQKNGQCAAEDHPSYEWGFSFVALFITTLLTFLFSLGTYLMWLDTHLHSRYNRTGRHMGTYRAALDLANALRNHIGKDVDEGLSNGEIKTLLQSRGMNAHVIAYALTESSPRLPIDSAPDDPTEQGGKNEKIDKLAQAEAQQHDHPIPRTRWQTFKIWHRAHGWPTWTWRQRITRIILPVTAVLIVIVVPSVMDYVKEREYYDYY